jgi:hypothetical protein
VIYLLKKLKKEKYLKLKNIKTTTFTIFLLFAIAVSLVALPTADSHTPSIKIPTHAYINAAPNPVGVGQQVNVVVWLNIALSGAAIGNDIRFKNYKLTITDPDGNNETITWDTVTDTTSSAYTPYIPNKVGTYSLVFTFPGQVYTWKGEYQNDTYLPSTSKTFYLTVQQEPLEFITNPLPTEYWTRPIETENTDWYSIASNFLNGPSYVQYFQPDGTAPNSAHVMWTKPIQDGGIVGGSHVAQDANTYYQGYAYNTKFTSPIIMYGRLYYPLPYGNAASGGGYMCVNLLTGEEIWHNDQIGRSGSGISTPTFGYLYAYEMENQHGVIPDGWLFSSDFADPIFPATGENSSLNIINVPSGITAYSPSGLDGQRKNADISGPSGEILRYLIKNLGNTTNPQWRLTQWNSSKVFNVQTTGTIDAGKASCYDWNVSISAALPTNFVMRMPILNDLLICSSGFMSFGGFGTEDPYTVFAISLKPESRGQLLWLKNYSAPADFVTRGWQVCDEVNRVFVLRDKETFQFMGYSIDDGSLLWTTKPIPNIPDFEYYDLTYSSPLVATAYGRLYSAGMSGVLKCYDTKNGNLLWTYGNGGIGNSTNSGAQAVFGNYPIYVRAIADGKVYLTTADHSPDTPLYKGAQTRCIDAYTGEEIWTILGYGGYPRPSNFAVADGYITYLNCYDMQIYCIGKGPSAITVEAPMAAITQGSSLVIRGTVTDIAAGTTQDEQASRFAHGVPAVSDESMSAWMEYVYMQKPRPTNTTGVQVTLNVLDANRNYRTIGTTTSDSDGFFTFNWIPDIDGQYTVYASFAGSKSYWPSHAVTSFAVDPAAAIPAATQVQTLSTTDSYLLPGIVGIILAIAMVGIGLALLITRKRP